MNKKLRKRCSCCEQLRNDVTKAPDPFAQEIHNDDTFVWMCESCRYESAMNV